MENHSRNFRQRFPIQERPQHFNRGPPPSSPGMMPRPPQVRGFNSGMQPIRNEFRQQRPQMQHTPHPRQNLSWDNQNHNSFQPTQFVNQPIHNNPNISASNFNMYPESQNTGMQMQSRQHPQFQQNNNLNPTFVKQMNSGDSCESVPDSQSNINRIKELEGHFSRTSFQSQPRPFMHLSQSHLHQNPPPTNFQQNTILPIGITHGFENLDQQGYQIKKENEHTLNQGKLTHDDQTWLESWLRNKQLKKKVPSSDISVADSGQAVFNGLKISEAQNNLKSAVYLMARLQKQMSVMENIKETCDEESWKQESEKATALKDQLDELHVQLKDKKTIDLLEKRIKARQEKRERIKRQRKREHEEKQEAMLERERKHVAIDTWQEKIKQKSCEIKQEKEMKATVDATLAEVRKKISEAKKATDLLQALVKLRKLRTDRLHQQGISTSTASNDVFEKATNKELGVLEKQLDLYTAEENALKDILEEEQEETREKEKERQKQLQKLKMARQEKETQEKIFGPEKGPLDESNPLFPYRQYYSQTDLSLQSLVQIRSEWDMFIVPDHVFAATRIPDGFILPPNPFSQNWETYLENKH